MYIILLLMLLSFASFAEITTKILFVDDNYYSQYAGDTKPYERYFLAQGFTPKDAEGVAEYMKNGEAPGSVILSLTDVSPKIWAEPFDKTSPIFIYCIRGGRFVNPGGNTLMAFVGKDEPFQKMFSANYSPEKSYIYTTFGIKPVYGLRGKDRVLTDYGKRWGLEQGYPQWATYLDLAVPSENVEPFVTAKEGSAALIWLKNVNGDYPYSGLLGACFALKNHLPTMELIYRVCLFDGEPVVNVPKVDYAERNDNAKDFEIVIERGGVPRSVFEQGETIPAKVVAKNADAQYGVEAIGPDGERMVGLDTTLWKECEYTIRCVSGGKTVAEKKVFIAARRRIQPYPLFIWKHSRMQPKREATAASYIAARHLNPCIDDIYQMTDGGAGRLGSVIDEALRHHQLFTTRTQTRSLFTDKKEEQIVLYNGKVHSHGANHSAMSSRAVAENPAKAQSEQVMRLLGTGAPNFYNYTVANDDGSMLGNFDFNPKTMADFERRTGVKRTDLPVFEKQKHGNNVFLPVVDKGIVPWNHPFLVYFRYHCGNYNRIAEATAKASHGLLVGDIGLMSGPLYPGRGFYPPLSHSNYPTNTFYNYTFWYAAIAFNLEVARTGGRDKPLGAVVSAHYTAWGREFQRGILYRVIANAPQFIGLWHLDESKDMEAPPVKSTWRGTEEVARRLAEAAEFHRLQRPVKRKVALLYDIAQICFQGDNEAPHPYSRYSALENFRRAGASCDVISSEEVVAGRLKNYDMVVLHDCQWMTDKVHELLTEYVNDGGRLVADSSVAIEVPGMERLDGFFGKGREDIGSPSCVALCAQAVKKHIGQDVASSLGIDSVLYINELSDKTPVVWLLDCETSDERKGCEAAMSKDWTHGAYEFLTATAQKTGLREHKLRVRDGLHAYDLFNHAEQPIGDGILTTRLALLDAVPLLLLKERIEGICITMNKRNVSRGATVPFTISIKGNGKEWRGGTVPAQVTVFCNGRERWEHGGNVVLDGGKAVFNIVVPINEGSGEWRIAVTELASGKIAEADFTVD